MKDQEVKFEPLKYFRTSGCIAPSSSFLVKKMLEKIDFESVEVIVEFGAGDGCFTREILKKLKPSGKLLSFEVNAEFCHVIQKTIKDDRFILIPKSAEEMTHELSRLGIEKVDCVVSSLPLVFIPLPSINNILLQVKNILAKKGVLLQFQYSLANNANIKRYFNKVIKTIELRNLPPAIIYRCINT